MSKYDKILTKLLNPALTLTFQELGYLLRKKGYVEKRTGKTSGSRKAYIQVDSKPIIRIHKPYHGNEIKRYVKLYIISDFKKQGLI